MSRRERREYKPEQKADAVRMVRQVGNLSKVTRDLDLTPRAGAILRRQALARHPVGSPRTDSPCSGTAPSTGFEASALVFLRQLEIRSENYLYNPFSRRHGSG